MANRREWRVPYSASVRIMGTSSSGQSFSGTAQTLDISRRGVRVSNADFLTRIGEVVTIQHMQRRAKYRVVWLCETQGSDKALAGLSLLENQPGIWSLDPGTGKPDTFDTSQRRGTTAPDESSGKRGTGPPDAP